MKKKGFLIFRTVVLMMVLLLVACETYKQQVLPLKLPAAYPNMIQVADTQIAGQAYNDEGEAKEAFGFNIRKAGLLPVRVVFDNKGSHPLEVVSSQTFLVDSASNLWPVLEQQMAYDRLAKSTEWGKVAPEAGKSAFLGGAAGAIIGAAIGIVSGHNIGEAIGKGAAVGAAAGATMGGVKGLTDQDVHAQIMEDLGHHSLKQKSILPSQVSYGFIFFPGEAKDARELRIQLRDILTGKIYPVNLRL
jgi:hypothetical protein